jgi:pimeloyl-ACP methyl ester carboxylesterase
MSEPKESLYYGNFDSDGVKIHYSRTSLGYAPVVLLHGLTDSGAIWNRLAAALYHSYDVVLPDARGHGYSDAPETGYSLQSMTKDAANLIQHFNFDKPVVIGHSMGAAVTANLAAEYPELVRAIVLIDPPWYPPEKLTEEFGEAIVANFLKGYDDYQKMTLPELMDWTWSIHPTWDEADVVPWSKARQQYSKNALEVTASLSYGWQNVAAKISCPALIMTADTEKGAILSQEYLAELLKQHPNWKSTYFENAGHSLQRDQFELSRQAITAYLKEIYR